MKTINLAYFEQIEEAYRDGSGASCNWAALKTRELQDHLQAGNKLEIQDDQRTVIINTLQELIDWKRDKNFPGISFGI